MRPSLLKIRQNLTHSRGCQQITMQRCYTMSDSYLKVTTSLSGY